MKSWDCSQKICFTGLYYQSRWNKTFLEILSCDRWVARTFAQKIFVKTSFEGNETWRRKQSSDDEEELDEITDVDLLPVVVDGSCLIQSVEKFLQGTFDIRYVIRIKTQYNICKNTNQGGLYLFFGFISISCSSYSKTKVIVLKTRYLLTAVLCILF